MKAAGQAAWKCEDQPDIDDAYKWQTQECVDAVLTMPIAPPFPEPLRVKPDSGTEVWCAHPAFSDFAMPITWMGSNGDLVWFERGLCHTAFEDAATHGWYLASLSAKTEDAA